MLIQFTVGNFRSFREPVTLSMEAAPIKSEDKDVDANNLIEINKNLTLLSSVAIYGNNASGKSNLLAALAFMRHFVLNSVSESQTERPIKVDQFRLSTATITKPAFFEIIFLLENQKYRYGFEVDQSKVEREWLYFTPTIREAKLFVRDGTSIQPNPRMFREGNGLEERTRPNALFLSVVGQFNGPIAQKIIGWFRNVRYVSGLNDVLYREFTLSRYQKDPVLREQILNLVHSLDVGIENVKVEDLEPRQMSLTKNISEGLRELILESPYKVKSTQTEHTQYDEKGFPAGKVDFDLEENESEGTKKLFFLSGTILDVLSSGKVFVVDEMEARMHPLITCRIIQLFNSKKTNPKHAQLIFTTHDTNLLNRNLFRRDQIWFVEKDSYGASHLYSLVEFKLRNDESYEKNYLRGKFGAIPYLGDISQIQSINEDENVETQEPGDESEN